MGIGNILGGKSRNSTRSTYTPVQSQQISNFLPQAESFYNAGVPDVSQTQETAQNAANAYTTAAGQLGTLGADTQAGQQTLLAAGNPNANPALQEYLKLLNDELNQSAGEQLARVSTQGAISGGLGGSGQRKLQSMILGDMFRQQALGNASLLNSAYGTGLNAVAQGVASAPTVANAYGAPGAAYSAAIPNQQVAETLPYNLERNAIQDYAAILGQNFGGTTTGPKTKTGGIAGALGGAATGGGIASALGTAGVAGAGTAAPWLIGGGAILGALN